MKNPKPLQRESWVARIPTSAIVLFALLLSIVLIGSAHSGEQKSEAELLQILEDKIADATTPEEARLAVKKFLEENSAALGDQRKEMEKAVASPAAWTNAMAQAKAKSLSVSCANNLKMLALSFNVWAGENGDKYPFQISMADGGSAERRKLDESGYDANALVHLRLIADELVSPKVLCCPADAIRKPSARLSSFDTNNITYQLRTDSKVTPQNLAEILLRCPIHGHVVFCGGDIKLGEKIDH